MSKSNRCVVCSKKTGINYFTCKCNEEHKFCSEHKFPFTHNCTINKAQDHKDRLTKLNIRVAPEKLTQI